MIFLPFDFSMEIVGFDHFASKYASRNVLITKYNTEIVQFPLKNDPN